MGIPTFRHEDAIILGMLFSKYFVGNLYDMGYKYEGGNNPVFSYKGL